VAVKSQLADTLMSISAPLAKLSTCRKWVYTPNK